MRILNTLTPYNEIDYKGIQYQVCRDFSHISRYKGLRQVAHNPNESDRFIALETPNIINHNIELQYYEVLQAEANRLDIIANKLLGSAQYAWVLAYFNDIDDGFTVSPGQRIVCPKSISSLFKTGEILASIPANTLNLGSE